MALVDNAWYINYGNGSSTGYYAVAAWAASTSYVCGNLIRQNSAPSVGNERVFVCIASTSGTGTSGGSEPTWTVTRGAKNTDNTVTWQEATGIAALNGDLSANTPTWATVKNTAITLGQVIQNVAGTLILICTTAGTAGNGSEPSWAAFTNAGATTSDNTVTWTTLGASFSKWAAPHARLANSFTLNWGQQGNNYFVASEHAETQASALTLNPQTGNNLDYPVNVVTCVGKTNVPPGSSDVTTGASISTTGNNNLTIISDASSTRTLYVNGVTFNAGTGANNVTLLVASNTLPHYARLDNCVLVVPATGSTGSISFGTNNQSLSGGAKIELNNTSISLGAAGQNVVIAGCDFVWRNTPSAIAGTTPTTLFTSGSGNGNAYRTFLDGVDLSALGSGKTLFGSGFTRGSGILIKDCKLGSSVTIAGTPNAIGQTVDLVRCDSSGTNYRHERYKYQGTQTVETSITRTGGAIIGTQAISQKIVTTANIKWVGPFEAFPRAVWNALTGANRTVTLYGTWNNASVPNTDDIWFDVAYLGASGNPQAFFATGTKANNLATGSAWTADSISTWGGGGSGAGWSPFKMTVTLSSPQPQLVGSMYIYVKAAKASSTFYIDPLPILS